jgi:protein-disulfide isomerase/uncharacterized membrane protein
MVQKQPPRATASRLNLPIFLVALFGVLVVTHLWIQVDRGFTHGCLGFSAPTGEIAECAEVIGSQFGSVFGVSNVALGLLFYLVLAGLRAGVALTRPPTSHTLQRASFVAVGVGLLYAVWLVSVQLFTLDRVCVLCMISAATTLTLFALHLVEWRQERGTKRAEPAVARVVSFRPYGVGLAALALLVAVDFVFLSERVEANPAQTASADGTPFRPTAEQLAGACTYDQELGTLRIFDLLTGGRAAFQGDPDAPVRVLKIFDPNCPHCKTLHAVIEQVVPEYNDRARFYYHPIALWDFSVPQVQALYLAREESHEAFVEMMDLQLAAQRRGGLPVDTLAAFAGRIGLDAASFRTHIERGRFADLVRQEYQMVTGAGVRGVPRLIVDGRVIANTQATWTPECLGYFIEQASARQGS